MNSTRQTSNYRVVIDDYYQYETTSKSMRTAAEKSCNQAVCDGMQFFDETQTACVLVTDTQTGEKGRFLIEIDYRPIFVAHEVDFFPTESVEEYLLSHGWKQSEAGATYKRFRKTYTRKSKATIEVELKTDENTTEYIEYFYDLIEKIASAEECWTGDIIDELTQLTNKNLTSIAINS